MYSFQPSQSQGRSQCVVGFCSFVRFPKEKAHKEGCKYMSKAPCDRGASPWPQHWQPPFLPSVLCIPGATVETGLIPLHAARRHFPAPSPHLSPPLSVLHTYSYPFCDITSGAKGGREKGDKLQAGAFPLCSSGKPASAYPKLAPFFPPTP